MLHALKTGVLGLMALTLAGCGHTPDVYRAEKPQLDFMAYFNGKVDGWGVIYDWRGRITHRFHVLMDGKLSQRNGQDFLRLDEVFTYSNGDVMERYWEVTRDASNPNTMTAQAPEVPGGASGTQSGNAVQWRYRFELPRGDSSITVSMNDWMWLVDDNTLMNRNYISKFGLPVAELAITFRKRGVPEGTTLQGTQKD